MFKAHLRKFLNKILRPLGIAVGKRMPLRKSEVLEVLKAAGLNPQTVIDVGVHRAGTPEIYETFPDVKTILIEPNDEFKEDILKFCKRLKDVELVNAAASDVAGQGKLQIHRTSCIHTALVDKGHELGYTDEIKEVDVITLDEMCKDKKLSGPYLIKVDVVGKDI